MRSLRGGRCCGKGWDFSRILIGWVQNDMCVFEARERSWTEGGRASGSSRSLRFATGRARGWRERKRRVAPVGMTKSVAQQRAHIGLAMFWIKRRPTARIGTLVFPGRRLGVHKARENPRATGGRQVRRDRVLDWICRPPPCQYRRMSAWVARERCANP